MYYTGKGDNGSSKLFNSKQRIAKSDLVFEVLGSLDELNSWMGMCSVAANKMPEIMEIIINIQNKLFICQAFFADAEIIIPKNIIVETEEFIEKYSKMIKARESFILSGGSQLSALFDVGRTLARKSERRAVELLKQQPKNGDKLILAFLNRLSSLLYVLARLANDLYNQEERRPSY